MVAVDAPHAMTAAVPMALAIRSGEEDMEPGAGFLPGVYPPPTPATRLDKLPRIVLCLRCTPRLPFPPSDYPVNALLAPLHSPAPWHITEHATITSSRRTPTPSSGTRIGTLVTLVVSMLPTATRACRAPHTCVRPPTTSTSTTKMCSSTSTWGILVPLETDTRHSSRRRCDTEGRRMIWYNLNV